MPTYSKKRDERVLRVSEADIRLVDAFCLEASNDPSPPTREEQIADAGWVESLPTSRQ